MVGEYRLECKDGATVQLTLNCIRFECTWNQIATVETVHQKW